MADSTDHATKMEFAELLMAHQSQLFSYIHSLLRNLDDTEDLFQQTSLVLWRSFAEYDRSRKFLPWACGIARLEVCNFLRSRSRRRLYFSDDLNLLLADTAAEMEAGKLEDERKALRECVEKLRPGDRDLLDECYGGEGSITEVADKHGRVPQSVQNSLRRIRRALFECVRRTIAQHERGLST